MRCNEKYKGFKRSFIHNRDIFVPLKIFFFQKILIIQKSKKKMTTHFSQNSSVPFLWWQHFIEFSFAVIKFSRSRLGASLFIVDNDPSHLHLENAFLMLYWIQLQTNQISQAKAKVSWLSSAVLNLAQATSAIWVLQFVLQ